MRTINGPADAPGGVPADVHVMIGGLSVCRRTVLHLRIVQGLSLQRTAEILHIRPTEVLRIQHEALNELRRQLGRASDRPSGVQGTRIRAREQRSAHVPGRRR